MNLKYFIFLTTTIIFGLSYSPDSYAIACKIRNPPIWHATDLPIFTIFLAFITTAIWWALKKPKTPNKLLKIILTIIGMFLFNLIGVLLIIISLFAFLIALKSYLLYLILSAFLATILVILSLKLYKLNNTRLKSKYIIILGIIISSFYLILALDIAQAGYFAEQYQDKLNQENPLIYIPQSRSMSGCGGDGHWKREKPIIDDYPYLDVYKYRKTIINNWDPFTLAPIIRK